MARVGAPDCSSCTYTCGLPLRKCLRLCSVIGITSSILYIMAGVSIIVHVAQTEKLIFTRVHEADDRTKTLHTRNRGGFFVCLSIVLILVNVIQAFSDILLFRSSLRSNKGKSLWMYFLLDIILWVMTLICFTAIFSGGGLFLLLVFLAGTTVRVYIIFVLHQYMNQVRKPSDGRLSRSDIEHTPEILPSDTLPKEDNADIHPTEPAELLPIPTETSEENENSPKS